MNIFEKIRNCEPIEDCESPIELFRTYESVIRELKTNNNQTVTQYNEVVEQNKNLQGEINALKKQPFFPYKLNPGHNMDFGEFILISHAWFTISNLSEQLGIIEVEWKATGNRKMYFGKGDSNGVNFKTDVLSIAKHGQKLRD